jgi:hypothetical protein
MPAGYQRELAEASGLNIATVGRRIGKARTERDGGWGVIVDPPPTKRQFSPSLLNRCGSRLSRLADMPASRACAYTSGSHAAGLLPHCRRSGSARPHGSITAR